MRVCVVAEIWEQPLVSVQWWVSGHLCSPRPFSQAVKSHFVKLAPFCSAESLLDLCKNLKNLFALYFLKKANKFSPVSLSSKQLIGNWLAVGRYSSGQPGLWGRLLLPALVRLGWGRWECRRSSRAGEAQPLLKVTVWKWKVFRTRSFPQGSSCTGN